VVRLQLTWLLLIYRTLYPASPCIVITPYFLVSHSFKYSDCFLYLSFGTQAIDNFLENNQLSYIIRAHEAHAAGVSLSKGAR
jgi:hypothetical protein